MPLDVVAFVHVSERLLVLVQTQVSRDTQLVQFELDFLRLLHWLGLREAEPRIVRQLVNLGADVDEAGNQRDVGGLPSLDHDVAWLPTLVDVDRQVVERNQRSVRRSL